MYYKYPIKMRNSTILHIVCLLFSFNIKAQSTDSTKSNVQKKGFPQFRFQIGFGSALTYCKADPDVTSLLSESKLIAETREQIPGLFASYRLKKKFFINASYQGFFKAMRAGQYAGSIYDNGSHSDWSGGILTGIFQGFGIEIPPSAPSAPGWYPVIDELYWEAWGEVVGAHFGYSCYENRYFRASFTVGPSLILTTESIYINAKKVYSWSNGSQYIYNQSGSFSNNSTGLDACAGLQFELKFLERYSLMVYSNGGLAVINPTSPEQNIEVNSPDGNKKVYSAMHKTRSSFVNAGVGLFCDFGKFK